MKTVIEQIEELKTEMARVMLHVEHLTKRFDLYKDHVDERLDSHSEHLQRLTGDDD